MKSIDQDDLERLIASATSSPRKRSNANLHPRLEDPVQRFLNAVEPGSYVRPHRHSEPARWELFALLAGRAAVVLLDDQGRVLRRQELHLGGTRVVEIPAGAWHTLAALEPGTVLLEIKEGPYQATSDKDFAPWAPAEGEPGSARLQRRIAAAREGESLADG